MALKSPYNPDDQIYEHLVQSLDSAIPPEELPAMYILPSLPVRHQSRRLSSFSRIHTIDGVKHVLVENGPVFIALPLYNSGPTFWKSNNDLAHDFHAVSIKGYDSNGFLGHRLGQQWLPLFAIY